MSRTARRAAMLAAGGPPRCPKCGERLVFGTDRLGRTTESCGCGHREYLALRADERSPLPSTNPIGVRAAR